MISYCLISRHVVELAWHAVADSPWPLMSWLWVSGYTVAAFPLAGWGYRRDEGERYR